MFQNMLHIMRYVIFFLIFIFVMQTETERVVITFHNSSLAQEAALYDPPNHTIVVKQYGRRLVLNITEWVPNQNDILDNFYGGSQIIEMIEEDVIISSSNIINASNDLTSYEIVQQSLGLGNFEDIEWQFAADEFYGMQVEKL